MREIEFRGFSINKKKWVYGNYNYTFERGYLSQGYDDVPSRCYYIDTETNYYEVYSQSIGQYTGLKDKNGKKIYEGHILQDKRKRKFKVTWNNDIGSWVNSPCKDSKSYPCFNIDTVKDLEIIGSIFENPELLESGE